MYLFTGRRKKNRTARMSESIKSSKSDSSKLSSHKLRNIIDKLMLQQNRSSTMKTYFRIWRQFNNFLIRLDVKPLIWEERVTLFIGHLVDKGVQSSSIKSYVSAIKRVLLDDGYQWDDQKILLTSLTRACRLINDVVTTRLPIQGNLLELLLFEIIRIMDKKRQIFLKHLYLALFSLGFYGLMRIGEVTQSEHVIRAENVHVATNKDKILLILYSSKTHDEANRPQKIKITANETYLKRHFCPFKLMRNYIAIRTPIQSENEQFFVFSDNSAVTGTCVRNILKMALNNLGLDSSLYGFHSLRIGRTSELINKFNYSISEVKLIGRWRSNVIYKYIRQ